MAIRDQFALGTAVPGNAASSGDGASVESATDPNTGNRNPDYVAPQPSQRQSTAVGDESAHNDVAAYQKTKVAVSTVSDDSNIGAGGRALGAS